MRSALVALTVTVAAAALAIAGCTGDADPSEGETSASPVPRGDRLAIAMLGDVSSWDPAQAHVGHYLQPYQAVYDTLILRAPDGTLEPMLATSWTYSDENTTLTLQLRDDVTFSDGAVFDAAAVKANLEHFQQAEGPQASQLASLESVAVLDEATVELTLSQADPAMPYYLSQAAGLMGSPQALGTTQIGSDPVGSGPYLLDAEASETGSRYALTAREDYWNPSLQRFDSLELDVIPVVTDRLAALEAGEVDAAALDVATRDAALDLGLTEYASLDGWQGLVLLDRDGQVNPAMGDYRVRQALNYAFDREAMLATLNPDNGEVTNQVFGTASGAYIPEMEEKYPYDPEMARDLLEQAGYGDGLTLTMPEIPDQEATYEMISEQLGAVGITVETEPITMAEIYTSITDKTYPMVWFQLSQGEAWVNINQWIAPSATQFNPFASTTPELAALLEDVQTAGEDAADEAREVNAYVTEFAWFVPWYRVNSLYFASPFVAVEPQAQQAVPSIYNFAPAS